MTNVHSPIREQIKLADRWHVCPVNEREASVFVPGPWGEKQVVLMAGNGEAPSAVRIENQDLERSQAEGIWQAGEHLNPGQWNHVAAADGNMAGARLVASNPLHISRLEATSASPHSLSVRVRLTDAPVAKAPAEGGEAPCLRSAGLLTLFFTLMTPDGQQVAGMEITLGRRTRDLSVEMPCHSPLAGSYRLKAALCNEEYVIDNARVDVTV